MAKKKKHHGFTHSHIEHHKDGSSTVHHQHSEGAHKDVKHAAADLNAVHDSMEQHLGAPNDGEGETMAGASAPAAAPSAAAPAGSPAPGGMPGMGA